MISFSPSNSSKTWQPPAWGTGAIVAFFWNQPVAERFDRIIEGLLVALLTFSPLAFGVVHAWSEQVVVSLAALLLGIFLLKRLLLPSTPFIWTWAYVPMGLFIMLALFQLVPLPSAVVGAFSPNTTELKTQLLAGVPDVEQVLTSTTLSFYPRATQHNIRLVLAVAAVFVVVVNVYRQPERVKRLLAAMAIIGGGIAVLALAQDIAGNGKIYWIVPTYDRASSGTFINHSHYGQFMNLSMGAALGLLLVMLSEAFTGRSVAPRELFAYAGSDEAKRVKLLVAMIVIGAATVFASLTRGGMLSMLMATVFTTLMLGSRQSLKSRSWLLLVLALGAFVCVLWVGFDQVYDRLASLRQIDTAAGDRWLMIKNTLAAWTRFPIVGTGLGTYEVVYPMFEPNSMSMSLASHAENEYAQALMETGCLGLATLIAFGAAIWAAYAQSIRSGSAAITSAAYGLGFGLLAILIHSLSDFGQHLPANALLTATCCGLLITLSQMPRKTARHRESVPKTFTSRADGLIAYCLAAVVFGWALLTAHHARTAEVHWKEVQLAVDYMETRDWQENEQVSTHLFDHATAAVEVEPSNIHYRHWLGVYEWLSLKPYVDPNMDTLASQMLPRAREIAERLHRARFLCPTFGATPCVAGEIEYFVLGDPEGAKHIQTGYRLASCHPTACFAAARVDAVQGKAEEAFAKAHRAVQLDGGYFPRAARLCIDVLNRPDLAVVLAQDHTGRLTQVANVLAASPQHTELIAQIQDDIFELLENRSRQPDATAHVFGSLGSLYHQRGELQMAIDHYRVAIKKDYDQVGWHYALARLLNEEGQIDEAIHEAEICLRLRPDHSPAKKIIEELSVRSAKAEKISVSKQ